MHPIGVQRTGRAGGAGVITFTLKEPVELVPLEAEALCPDTVATLGNDAIRALPVYLGKRQCRIDDFFTVDGEASDELEIRGELRKVRWVGRGMSRGRMKIVGNVGMHLGGYMKGGTIDVSGSASDWVGGEMSGGMIRIAGHAGGQIGAAYRGSRIGMTNGTIVVGGSAGLEIGMRMKRGTIVIGGAVRDFAGLEMKGGTIILRSGAELRTGAWMNRGTIISLAPIPLLPSFLYATTYIPSFMGLYAKHLQTLGIALPHNTQDGAYKRYVGDTSVIGKGEILVWAPQAS
ncbi:MAG: formylmethanofuran dehydrogenase subunit C [Acidobacteriota bacterium]